MPSPWFYNRVTNLPAQSASGVQSSGEVTTTPQPATPWTAVFPSATAFDQMVSSRLQASPEIVQSRHNGCCASRLEGAGARRHQQLRHRDNAGPWQQQLGAGALRSHSRGGRAERKLQRFLSRPANEETEEWQPYLWQVVKGFSVALQQTQHRPCCVGAGATDAARAAAEAVISPAPS